MLPLEKITPQGVEKLRAALPNAPFVKKDDREWEFQAPHETFLA
jgi:hypothetical protein